ncbi:hypothetical protein FHG87_018057 [Trinorchestia longiramus]|nr:hypothetical protein FHG87_018057 [Trinorchestia longiramus]
MSTYKPDCRKFQANIFNKSKCTNCFRQREEHSTDALDSNRVSSRGGAEGSKSGFFLFDGPLMWQVKIKDSPRLLYPISESHGDSEILSSNCPSLSSLMTVVKLFA